MVQVARRAGLTDSALVRLLARLTEHNPGESAQSFTDRLSDWLRWTDAMSLFTALQDSPAPRPGRRRAAGADRAAAQAGAAGASDLACQRVREALEQALADDGAHLDERPMGRRPRTHLAAPTPILDIPVDFSPYRRHYQDSQQTMETAIGPVRAQLRERLAAGTPDMARLAQVDAVMEQVLGPHERRLLSTLPSLLHRRFERERDAASAAALADPTDAGHRSAPPAPAAAPWQSAFRQDLHAVLQAELALRWQPVDGLLAALAHETP